MKEYTATTTQRNQVTIPAAVRRLLGIKPRDKVAFTIDDAGTVRLAARSVHPGVRLRLRPANRAARRL